MDIQWETSNNYPSTIKQIAQRVSEERGKLPNLISHTSPEGHLRLQFVIASSQSKPQKKLAMRAGIGAYVWNKKKKILVKNIIKTWQQRYNV